jgi:RES domain-containing protein
MHHFHGLRRAVRDTFVARSPDDGIPSRSPVGRFHKDGARTTYLAFRSQTARLEVSGRFPRFKRTSFRMLRVSAELQCVIDLTDPAIRRRYGMTRRSLVERDHARCQQLAERLRAEGVEAIVTFSRADGEGRQLVVFLDRLRVGSRIVVHDSCHV